MNKVKVWAAALLLGLGGLGMEMAWGQAAIDGYLTARLGMTVAEVKASFARDGVVAQRETLQGGDPMLVAARGRGAEREDLVYGFTGEEPRLALVNVFYKQRQAEASVRAALASQFGKPIPALAWVDKAKEELQRDFGAPVEELEVWTGPEESEGRRFVKFVRFADFLLVQYYDSKLMDLAR